MVQRGSALIVLVIAAAVVAAGGCSTSSEVVNQREIIGGQIREIDSLRALTRSLYTEVGLLRDSLQFIDDIETGQYYRDMRALEDRIRRLEFLLHQQRNGITVAVVPADAIYQPASAVLTERGEAILDSVAAVINRSFPDHEIRVEGHADPSPLGPTLTEKYGDNWGLSTARAATVVGYLIHQANLPEDRILAIGFGSSRPVASNDTPAGRRQNRRIRISAVPPYRAATAADSATADS